MLEPARGLFEKPPPDLGPFDCCAVKVKNVKSEAQKSKIAFIVDFFCWFFT